MSASKKPKLSDFDIEHVYHCTPLHYLLFIARSRQLKSKNTLLNDGYADSHFRSMSKKNDIKRGFPDYVHLSLTQTPRILKAKLEKGFPHIEIKIPSEEFDNLDYDLCRYNIAMTRYLKRNGDSGFKESSKNGKYYGNMQIPIARINDEKKAMLEENIKTGTMVELLVKEKFLLPDKIGISCFSQSDRNTSEAIVRGLNLHWNINLCNSASYNVNSKHLDSVNAFIEKASKDETWKGDGLEYDRL